MFTGIVQSVCQVSHLSNEQSVTCISVQLNEIATGVELGASVALNGVCLTAVSIAGSIADFEVVSETARLTNLSELELGSAVNVERSLRFGDEVGGHVLAGHIADTVQVKEIHHSDRTSVLSFEVPTTWRRYFFTKGFVALNGVSLTLAEFDAATGVGSVNLIPETMSRTNLSLVKIGDRLNLEVDAQTQAIVDTVRSYLDAQQHAGQAV